MSRRQLDDRPVKGPINAKTGPLHHARAKQFKAIQIKIIESKPEKIQRKYFKI